MSIYKDAVKDALYPKKSGVLSIRNKYISFPPPKMLNPDEIRKLRLNLKLSVALFASLLCVSPKSVEAWESGRNVPSGPALRLMNMIKRNPDILFDGGSIIDLTN